MLKKANERFLEGFFVIVTAWNYRYALDLEEKVCYMLACADVPFKAYKHVITYNGIDMVFTKHFEDHWDLIHRPFINMGITYMLFEDHFKGVEYEHGIY